jgi:hypothetical protein
LSFNGTGTFTQATAPVVAGTVISSTNYNTQNTDFVNGLSNVICKDGQTQPTANLPMATYRHTGVGNAVARTDYAATGQVQDGSFTWCGTAGGTADALTLTPSPAISAYATGQRFQFKASSSANTGAATVAVSGLTAKAIQLNDAALVAGDIAANKYYEILYDGTAFQLTRVSGTGGAPASETVAGIIEIATAAETTTGTDDTRAITPLKLTTFAPATATIDTAADKVIFLDATDSKIKQGSFPSTSLAKPQSATYATNADLSTTIPVDDSIPQSSEGTEIVTVSITPSSASNKVRVRAYFYGQGNSSVVNMVGAIFRDSVANALTGGVGYARSTATNTAMGAFIEVVDSPATTSATTYKLRIGPDAGTMRLNGSTSARLFGGAMTVGIFVEEVPV